MDEVARVVSTAFTLSNDLRRDVEVTILFQAEPPPRARRMRLDGRRLKFLNPDERSTAALLKNALVRSAGVDRDVEASPGLVVGPASPIDELRAFAGTPGTIWLTEGGAPIEGDDTFGGSFRAILSDPTDPTAEEVETIRTAGARPRSLGRRSLRSSQCVTALHHIADGAEGSAPTDAGRIPDPGPV